MLVRRATPRDYPGLIELQEANLLDNLTPEQRKDGFLSARVTEEQFAQMNRDAAIVVAEEDGRIVGYACCGGVESGRQLPILAAMIATFNRVTFLGSVLVDSRVALYGPVCIDRACRSRGVFRKLIDQLREELAGQFEVAVGFIAKSNSRSLTAHVDGLGMNLLGDYGFEGKQYWIVAFGIPPADLACGVGPRSR